MAHLHLPLTNNEIDTCRKRNIPPWPYLARVVAEWRKGNSAPPLPAASQFSPILVEEDKRLH